MLASMNSERQSQVLNGQRAFVNLLSDTSQRITTLQHQTEEQSKDTNSQTANAKPAESWKLHPSQRTTANRRPNARCQWDPKTASKTGDDTRATNQEKEATKIRPEGTRQVPKIVYSRGPTYCTQISLPKVAP
jgi:hypothetical protein